MNRFYSLFTLLLTSFLLVSCAGTHQDATNNNSHFVTANNSDNTQVKIVKEYIAIPLEKQTMSLIPKKGMSKKQLSKIAAVNAANKTAMQIPHSTNFINSIMNYNFMEGALYTIYTAPGQITDIQFAPNEKVNSYAAGDTMRWKIAKTFSGNDPRYEHLLIKPIEPNLTTTLYVMTNSHVYHMILKSNKTAFMAMVKWSYPNAMVSQLASPFNKNKDNNKVSSSLKNVDLSKMDVKYKVKSVRGNTSAWQPNLVFNDGLKTYIRFPASMNVSNMPILKVDAGQNHYSSTINYHFQSNYMIIDAIFPRAQLVLGDKHDDNLAVVQIDKET